MKNRMCSTEYTECQAFSSVRIGSPRLPHPQASVALPMVPGRGTQSLAGEEVGGANSDEGTDLMVPYSRHSTYNSSTICTVPAYSSISTASTIQYLTN